MKLGDLELLAEAAYLRAGLPITDAAAPLHIAGLLLGWNQIYETRAACSAVITSERLVMPKGLSKNACSWQVARALSRWLLEGVDNSAGESEVDMLAACIRTPRAAFEDLAADTGPAFSDLASAFRISESSAALRFGEVIGSSVVLFAPGKPPRMRGIPARKARARVVRLADDPARTVRLSHPNTLLRDGSFG